MRTILKKTIPGLIIRIIVLTWICCLQNVVAGASSGMQTDISASSSTITGKDIVGETLTSEADSSGIEAAYKEDLIMVNDSFASFQDAIAKLYQQYDGLRIRGFTYPSDPTEINPCTVEVDGVCFLRLIDFDNNGINELFAVCKNECECSYTGYLFIQDDEDVKCVFKNCDVTYKFDYSADDKLRIVYDPPVGHKLITGHYNWDDNFSYVYGFEKGELKLLESHFALWSRANDYGEPVRGINDEIIDMDKEADKYHKEENRSYEDRINVELRTTNCSAENIKKMITELENSVTNVKRELGVEDKNICSLSIPHDYIRPEEADYSLYKHVIENLEEKYGNIRINEETGSYNRRWRKVNGLCYLNLMDLNNNNIKELIALCSNDHEYTTHLYIYSIERGQVSCVLEIGSVGFSHYREGNIPENTRSTLSVWITNDAEGNAAIITGGINGDSEEYNIYGYDGLNYRLFNMRSSVDDKTMNEWSLKKNSDPLSDSWTPSETFFCYDDFNCERIDIDFLKKMIKRTKKDVF